MRYYLFIRLIDGYIMINKDLNGFFPPKIGRYIKIGGKIIKIFLDIY